MIRKKISARITAEYYRYTEISHVAPKIIKNYRTTSNINTYNIIVIFFYYYYYFFQVMIMKNTEVTNINFTSGHLNFLLI